jgi:uncharacterized membrane protein YdjX (TVP38/TMEM64 family)
VVEHVRDEEQLRATVADAGVLGPVLFVGLMALLVPLNVPGVLFVVPSTSLFGTAGGVALSLVGGFVASAVGVAAARRLGRPVFDARLSPRARRLEQRLARRGFWGVVAVRSFTYLMQPVDWLCGLSSIPMRTVLAGTFVGLIPPTFVITLGGGSLFARL